MLTTRLPFLLLFSVAFLIGPGPASPYSIGNTPDPENSSTTSQADTDTKQPVQTEKLYENVHKKYGVPPDIDQWQVEEWAHSSPLSLQELRDSIVVVRFWTNTCPYCAKSMPALQQLKRKLKDQPVRFIGIYHPKPYGTERPWNRAVEMAENWRVTFPIAHDSDWTTLKDWWLSTGDRRATSCTFVFNHRGHVTYIHPGPVYHPGDPETSQAARDYRDLRSAIRHALERRKDAQPDRNLDR